MSLLYTDVEQELRASVRRLFETRSPSAAVLERVESDEPVDTPLWTALATDIGCAGLAIPEKLGGAGASWREVAVVAEEVGRAVAPVPFLGNALATAALLAAGDEELLPSIASGERTAVLVLPLGTPPGGAPPAPGTVRGVADARTADLFVVVAPDGVSVAESATVTPVTALDLTRPLADVTVQAPRRIADGEAARRAWEAALATGAVLLASEQLGVAEWCLSTTVEYLRTRHQFGRPVGSFQGLKHRLAELWVTVTQARAVARYAADCLAGQPVAAAPGQRSSASGDDLPVAAALAQAHCAPVAVRAAEECVQLHGGIGFTWEHPAHLYLKRAKADALAFGAPHRHREVLGALVDLTP
jgi:alkylation response protein AidB-like acyl-CoA dehydrogenase